MGFFSRGTGKEICGTSGCLLLQVEADAETRKVACRFSGWPDARVVNAIEGKVPQRWGKRSLCNLACRLGFRVRAGNSSSRPGVEELKLV